MAAPLMGTRDAAAAPLMRTRDAAGPPRFHSSPCAPPHSARGGCPEGTSDAPQEPGPDNGSAQLLLTGTPPHRMATCSSLGLGVVGRCRPHRWDGPRAPCWQRRRSCPQMSQAAEHPFLLARAGSLQELQVVGGSQHIAPKEILHGITIF